jgi:hypothetical protein
MRKPSAFELLWRALTCGDTWVRDRLRDYSLCNFASSMPRLMLIKIKYLVPWLFDDSIVIRLF